MSRSLLREALLSLAQIRRREALALWQFETVIWSQFAAQGGKKRAPEVPAVLKG